MAKENRIGRVFAAASLIAIAATGNVVAMQNPIYNGVNRIELSCANNSKFHRALCSEVKTALETQMRLRVTISNAQTNKTKNGLIPLGALNVELDLAGNPPNRARLVWTNKKPIGPKPTTKTSEWIRIDMNSSSPNDLKKIARKLASTAP